MKSSRLILRALIFRDHNTISNFTIASRGKSWVNGGERVEVWLKIERWVLLRTKNRLLHIYKYSVPCVRLIELVNVSTYTSFMIDTLSFLLYMCFNFQRYAIQIHFNILCNKLRSAVPPWKHFFLVVTYTFDFPPPSFHSFISLAIYFSKHLCFSPKSFSVFPLTLLYQTYIAVFVLFMDSTYKYQNLV